MDTARTAKYAILATSISVAALVFPLNTWAASGNTQICQPNSSCTVGEFLYDDSYTPIIDAICTITSRYPDGSSFLNALAMTAAAQGDGWYSYAFTAPEILGFYRTEIKCTIGTEVLALDKSFTVKPAESTLSSSDVTNAVWDADRNSNATSGSFGEAFQNTIPSADDIASSVWGYSNRTLSTFGSLITDIWTNPTRTLSGFGTLVADIWASATRTLTGTDLSSGKLATQSDVSSAKDEATAAKNDVSTVKSDVSSIKDTVGKINSSATTINNVSNIQNVTNEISNIQNITNETRTLLEQVINRPIIENGLESDDQTVTLDLQSKLDRSTSLTGQLLTSSNFIKSKVSLMQEKWNKLDSNQLKASLDNLASVVGNENDDFGKNSFFGQIDWIKKQWDFPVSSQLYTQTQKLSQQLMEAGQNLSNGGKTVSASKQIKAVIPTLDRLISLSNILSDQIEEKKRLSQTLDKNNHNIDALLAQWNYTSKSAGEKPDSSIYDRVVSLSKQIASINQLPKINNLLTLLPAGKMTQKELRNKTLSLKGAIEANRQFLTLNSSKPFGNLWLEEGSTVFKTLIINPSTKTSQTVPLKYYLPKEVTKENITKTDEGLSVNYDMDKDQYFVSGKFTLAPGESKTVSVTVDDSVFTISDQNISTIRKQAEDLTKPLTNTSYFAQGITLKSDIDASLDRVEALQKEGATPEAKIKAFRDSQIEYKYAEEKLEKLKELTTTAGSIGTLFGFVGGAQVIATWGLILIIITGFVLLALYMKTIKNSELAILKKSRKPLSLIDQEAGEYYNPSSKPTNKGGRPILMLIILLTGGLITLSTLYAGFNVMQNLSRQDPPPAQSPKAVLGNQITKEEADVIGKEVSVFVPKDNLVSVFKEPSVTSQVLTSLNTIQKAKEISRQESWVKVAFEGSGSKTIIGWVDQDFVESKEQLQDIINSQKSITVTDTPTGFLRVRKFPGGQELSMVSPGEEYPMIQRQSDWTQIVLGDGTLGWVSDRYIK